MQDSTLRRDDSKQDTRPPVNKSTLVTMWMFNGHPATGGGEPCDAQQGQLLTSLTTYIELYTSHKDYFTNTADNFSRLSMQAQEDSEESMKANTTKAILFGLCGGSLGATVGAVSGGIVGGVGAVTAAALYRVDLNAVSASVGFFGGVLGSVIGAVCAGLVGGAVGAAAESTGHSMDNKSNYLMWYAIGGTLGAQIGHIFGGKVGTIAGALGGGTGSLCGVYFTNSLLKEIFKPFRKASCSKVKKKYLKDDSVVQTFHRNTSPLVAELSIIHTISSKMDAGVGKVAAQSSRCLNTVSMTKKALTDAQETPEAASCLKKAAQQCIHMTEELEVMKSEAEKVLASWSRQNNTF
ncbi:hypothetical protein WMY93_010732 [Mugilogobius chulae]|uniref:Uncharacterized protein n=1 Tax=Mugilogobius chulae TaxID=88201 RepID=A0AAW0P891_9GOBI